MNQKQKNIIICLDGTGNKIEENISNVLKLFRVLNKSDRQIVFYDQGVGTLGDNNTWGFIRSNISKFFGLAFGFGLDENVIKAYDFIAKNYSEYKIPGSNEIVKDKIFIFGFSRGAHTARVLAGVIYEVGLVRPEQLHLSQAAIIAYKRSKLISNHSKYKSSEDFEGEGANFRRIIGTRTISVEFLGVWDTVSAVFVPNFKKLWPVISREALPHTKINPAVKNFRHAISVDERRRMFRVDHWGSNQKFKPNIHSEGDGDPQNSQEVWFPGCHSDVGGGNYRASSGLSQIPFMWMVNEAEIFGIDVSERMFKYVSGLKKWSNNTNYVYPEPDEKSPLHQSKWWWKAIEYIPKNVKYRDFHKRRSIMNFYIPNSEPRFIPSDALLHDSVKFRIDRVEDYDPENLRDIFQRKN